MLTALHSEPARPVAPASRDEQAAQDYGDKITLSDAGVEQSKQNDTSASEKNPSNDTGDPAESLSTNKTQTGQSSEALTAEGQKIVQELKSRDQAVRMHEQAHLASAGQYARGGPSYTYQQGPDGHRYAIGGEVPIDVGREKTLDETIQKMQTVRRAAMAPADPSPADRSIAAAATSLEAQARKEKQTEQNDTTQKIKGGRDRSPLQPDQQAEGPSRAEHTARSKRTVDLAT